jgi:hypothetical protein
MGVTLKIDAGWNCSTLLLAVGFFNWNVKLFIKAIFKKKGLKNQDIKDFRRDILKKIVTVHRKTAQMDSQHISNLNFHFWYLKMLTHDYQVTNMKQQPHSGDEMIRDATSSVWIYIFLTYKAEKKIMTRAVYDESFFMFVCLLSVAVVYHVQFME